MVRPVRDALGRLLRSLQGDGLEPLLDAGGGAGCQRRAGSPRAAIEWLVGATARA